MSRIWSTWIPSFSCNACFTASTWFSGSKLKVVFLPVSVLMLIYDSLVTVIIEVVSKRHFWWSNFYKETNIAPSYLHIVIVLCVASLILDGWKLYRISDWVSMLLLFIKMLLCKDSNLKSIFWTLSFLPLACFFSDLKK